jgi:hypothetical protein
MRSWGVLGHFCALVPGERPAQLIGQGAEGCCDGVADRLGAVAGQGRPVLDGLDDSVALHGRQVQEHGEAAGSLDESADR